MDTPSVPRGAGLFSVRRPGTQPVITNIRRLAGQEADTGSRLIAAATAALAVLGAGLLAVSYAAQKQYLFGARHENWPSVIEALALDLAMLIFGLLALGLAKKGLPARTERAAVVLCAAGSAFMNYLASDIASPRSVAAYVMPPLLLALAADRVIAVVRRWVIGPQVTEGSVWRTLGRALTVAVLYGLRFVLAPVETPKGLRRVILTATPLPAPAAERINWPTVVAELGGLPHRPQVPAIEAPKDQPGWCHWCGASADHAVHDGDAVIVPGPGQTKKDVFLRLYHEHPNYGDRVLASKTASELAPRAGLQPGTARSYVYAELAQDQEEATA